MTGTRRYRRGLSICLADSRGSESNSRLAPPTVGGANRTVGWPRRQSGEQIERSFGPADGRGSESNGILASPAVGGVNRTTFWQHRKKKE